MPAFFSSTIADFLDATPDRLIGVLTRAGEQANFYQQLHSQTAAWDAQIAFLKAALAGVDGHIFIEFPIPRRGKRIDVVLLVSSLIFVVEFKVGERRFTSAAIAQVEDYCLDLRDFHLPSRDRLIVPVLVATGAKLPESPDDVSFNDKIAPHERVVPTLTVATALQLQETIHRCLQEFAGEAPPVEPSLWDRGSYSPTPTIIEAARFLYAGNNVRDISRCEAGADNLTATTEAVLKEIDLARADGMAARSSASSQEFRAPGKLLRD